MQCVASNLAPSIQSDDIALAKLLQEQERALWLLARGGSEEPEEEVELTDEELARRLQQEEDEEAYRMLYGAGVQDEAEAAMDGTDDPSAAPQDAAPDAEAAPEDAPLSYEDMLALGDLAGHVSRGLAPEALRALPVLRVADLRGGGRGACSTSGAAAAGGAVALCLDRCCICQLEFEEEDEATPLPCKHCYHPDCVRQWLQQSKCCPVCNQELVGGPAAGAGGAQAAVQ